MDARTRFRELHTSGCFIIPNPPNAGAARFLESAGFKAVATTSSGMAHTFARADNQVTLEMALGHIEHVVAAVEIPVNADFENAFARDPDDVAANVRRCVSTGCAGLSVEDSTGDAQTPLFEIGLAADRVAAARAAIDASGGDVMLTARAENFVAGVRDIDDVVARIAAYKAAGADVIFAPGLRGDEQISAVIAAAAPLPVNVLAGPGMTLAHLASLGARRLSVGGHLSRVAWAAFAKAATELASTGDFDALAPSLDAPNLNELFGS